MSKIEIHVPDIGDFKEVEVIELLVKPGDTIKPEQSLITVESDKASMEIPSSHAGVVKELKVKIGDKIAEGSLVLMLEVTEAAAGTTPVAASAPAATSAPATAATNTTAASATPSAAASATTPAAASTTAAPVAGGRPRWLHRCFPCRRSRAKSRTGRTLRVTRRCLPQCRLHSIQSFAARCQSHYRS